MSVLLPLTNAKFAAGYETKTGILTVSLEGDTDGTVVVYSLDRVQWLGGLKYALEGYYGGAGNPPATQHIKVENAEPIELPSRVFPSGSVLIETANGTTKVPIHYSGVIPSTLEQTGEGPNLGSVLPPIKLYLPGGTPGKRTKDITALIPQGDWEISPKFDQKHLMIWSTNATAKSVRWFVTWLKTPENPKVPVSFTVYTNPEVQAQADGLSRSIIQPYLIYLVLLDGE